jgi:hypothetical protein
VKQSQKWLLGGTIGLLLGSACFGNCKQQASDQNGSAIQGLPASDVLGSEDIWDNPTFVGGVIDGGPVASSEY